MWHNNISSSVSAFVRYGFDSGEVYRRSEAAALCLVLCEEVGSGSEVCRGGAGHGFRVWVGLHQVTCKLTGEACVSLHCDVRIVICRAGRRKPGEVEVCTAEKVN